MQVKTFTKILFFSLILFVSLVSTCYSQESGKVILFHFVAYRNDTVFLKTGEVLSGTVNISPSDVGDYELQITSSDEETLFETKLNFVFEFHRDVILPNGTMTEETVVFNETEQLYRLPYFENADKITIYHFDESIFEYEIPHEQKTTTTLEAVCGNKICETDETTNCPQDCESTKPTGIPFYVYAIIIIVVIAIVALFIKKMRVQQT